MLRPKVRVFGLGGLDLKETLSLCCDGLTFFLPPVHTTAYADGIASFTGMPLSNFSDVTCARSLQKLACKATFAACEIGQHTTALCSDTCAQVAGDCSGLPKNATDAILRLCETVQAVEGEHPHCKPFNYNGANVTDWIIGFSLQIVFALYVLGVFHVTIVQRHSTYLTPIIAASPQLGSTCKNIPSTGMTRRASRGQCTSSPSGSSVSPSSLEARSLTLSRSGWRRRAYLHHLRGLLSFVRV